MNPQRLVRSLFGRRVGETEAERSSNLCAKGKTASGKPTLPNNANEPEADLDLRAPW